MEPSVADTDISLLPDKNDNSVENDRRPPIDRGWAWVITAVCLYNYFILGGLLYSGGVFFVEFLRLYHASTSSTAVISGVQAASISAAVCFFNYFILMGLMISGGIFFVEFLNLYQGSTSMTAVISGVREGAISAAAFISQIILLGFLKVRTIVMCGGFLASLGIILASFANSVPTLVISFGMLTGFGIGMVLIPELALLGRYFNKRRAIATAIAMVGVNLGGITVPIFIRFLIDEYSVRGALLIYGGIMLNTIIAGGLLRPLDLNMADYSDSESDISKSPAEEKSPVIFENGVNSKESLLNEKDSLSDVIEIPPQIEVKEKELLNDELPAVGMETLTLGKAKYISESDDAASIKDDLTNSLRSLHFGSTPSILCVSLASLNRFNVDGPESVEISTEESSVSENGSVCQRLHNILDFSLFTYPLFILLLFTSVFAILVGAVPAIYIPALALSKGLTMEDGPYLLSAVSASGVVSKLLIGLFADTGCIRKHVLLIICLIGTGVTFCLVTVVNDMVSLLLFAISYGIFGSIYFSLMPVIIVDFLGLDKLAACVGFIEVFHGSSLAASHPFIGWLRDMTGNYDLPYHFLGAASFLSAFLLSLEPLVRKIQNKRKNIKSQYSLDLSVS